MNTKHQCTWSTKTNLESNYHNCHWAVPITSDTLHFEFITLEAAQAGLSWYTILKKRDSYKEAFANFCIDTVSKFTQEDEQRLLQDKGIIRHKQKIAASINNAKCFLKIQEEQGSFNNYIWSFVNNKPINNQWENERDIPSSTALSDKVSKDLKKRGFKFVGTTTIYAYLQAAGIINDHTKKCFRYKEILKIQKELGF